MKLVKMERKDSFMVGIRLFFQEWKKRIQDDRKTEYWLSSFLFLYVWGVMIVAFCFTGVRQIEQKPMQVCAQVREVRQELGQKPKLIKMEQEEPEQQVSIKKIRQEIEKEKKIQQEKEILQRIVEAEATGEDLKGKILVANVILNRVKDKRFPNTIRGVVFQRKGGHVQFSPTKDGRYWSVHVSKESKKAVEAALSGVDYAKGALYFSARSKADKNNMHWFDHHLKWLFRYGGHEFYKNR